MRCDSRETRWIKLLRSLDNIQFVWMHQVSIQSVHYTDVFCKNCLKSKANPVEKHKYYCSNESANYRNKQTKNVFRWNGTKPLRIKETHIIISSQWSASLSEMIMLDSLKWAKIQEKKSTRLIFKNNCTEKQLKLANLFRFSPRCERNKSEDFSKIKTTSVVLKHFSDSQLCVRRLVFSKEKKIRSK